VADRRQEDDRACPCRHPLLPGYRARQPHGANAIAVRIDGATVGYLSRADAAEYRPGLLALQEKEGCLIGLSGVIVGGGIRADGLGMLGIWLQHDPADFGLRPVAPLLPPVLAGQLRTGLTEALNTDAADASYDLAWLTGLPTDHIAAISRLRRLLTEDPDPIDRHYMYGELERRLYRSRDAFDSALDEYDETCRRHDAEMDVILAALLAKFGKVPVLTTYTQATIRHQKAKNWSEAIRWAQRGLELYGDRPARPEVVDDLKKRIATYETRL
jgi:tetratricopeptide (TPR) repeat protein